MAAHRPDVAAGAEGAPGAGEDDGADLVVRVERGAALCDAVVHLLGQRVQLVRAVQGDGGDAVLFGDQYAHGASRNG
ncbi:hypothetical protein D3C83_196220 [compost metagenome]